MSIALTAAERDIYEKTYRDLRLRLIKGRCSLAYAKERLARFRRGRAEGERLEQAGEPARKSLPDDD